MGEEREAHPACKSQAELGQEATCTAPRQAAVLALRSIQHHPPTLGLLQLRGSDEGWEFQTASVQGRVSCSLGWREQEQEAP